MDNLSSWWHKKNMRPIHHPAAEDITVEGILHALSDPIRASIFAELQKAECPKNCSELETLDYRTLPKSTLSQHFKILREAGLISSVRQGVELQNSTRCEELKGRFGEMIKAILHAYASQISKKRRR
jgi:DNA-binding transcriptional ArsR family regulator